MASINPLSYLRRRLDTAIRWRVRGAVAEALSAHVDDLHGHDQELGRKLAAQRDELEALRDLLHRHVKVLGSKLGEVSTGLTEEQRALSAVLDQIDRRLAALENDSPNGAIVTSDDTRQSRRFS